MTKSAFSRRDLLFGTLALGAGALSLARVRAATPSRSRGGKVKIEKFSARGKSEGVVEAARVVKTTPSGARSCRRTATRSRATKGPSARSRASMPPITHQVYIAASAARRRSSIRGPSSNPARAGRASTSRSRAKRARDRRPHARDEAHRGLLQPLRRAPRSRFRRRTPTDRAALLHELRGAAFRSPDREGLMNTTTVGRFRRRRCGSACLRFPRARSGQSGRQ